MTWAITSLSINGIKGVLNQSGDFKLKLKAGKAKSIAIFGRNGHGKSGYADAIEYFFSMDGEVEHLGKGGADSEQGGKHAIPHVLAGERGITPKLEIEFTNTETGKRVTIEREVVTGRNDTRPAALEEIVSRSPAHRILRQHDLRRFVVDMRPGEKFSEFARWIGLESSARLLGFLTTTERTLGNTDVDREISERVFTLGKFTRGAIRAYDLNSTLRWCESEVSSLLHENISISSEKDIDESIQFLRSRREKLILESKAGKAHQSRAELAKGIAMLVNANGELRLVETSFNDVLVAEQNKGKAEFDAKNSVFKDVWESAYSLIATVPPDKCPVCETPWPETAVQSKDNALISLNKSLESLQAFKTASEKLRTTRNGFQGHLGDIHTLLNRLAGHATVLDLTSESLLLSETAKKCEAIQKGDKSIDDLNPDFYSFLADCNSLASTTIPNALNSYKLAGQPTAVTQIENTIEGLQKIKEALDRLKSLQKEHVAIRKVESEFKAVADAIRTEVKSVAERAVGELRSDIEKIYKQIHPGESVPKVFIDLNSEGKTLAIRVGFHSEERLVPPGGYLSEAQINTLGLALFLSSIRLFNKEFPFVFLDDIVSSYDAENRARIVDILAEYMEGFQIFLTTHDERFYSHLKQRLESENWIFEKIVGLDFEKGPRRLSDNLKQNQITDLVSTGDSGTAGNSVRQFIEEWCDKKCEAFNVLTLHKRDTREYQRTLYDFWQPLMHRVENLGAGYGNYVNNSMAYKRLKATPLLNYYSHYQANPYEWGAIGDVEYVWSEFQEFVKMFDCHSCGKALKFDQNDSRLYCTCGGIILPAAPVEPQPATSQTVAEE